MAQVRMASGKVAGTRDRVVAWLAANGDIHEPRGMASTALARHIGYPGTSTAFAQLLSGMERSGLIARDIRGKRTYQVSLIDAGWRRAKARGAKQTHPGVQRSSGDLATPRPTSPSSEPRDEAPDEASGVLDYDALAHRILVQVAHRLAAVPNSQWTQPAAQGTDLDARVSALNAELQRARANRTALEQENMELRAQLERIRRSLESAAPRLPRTEVAMAVEPLDSEDDDIALLQRVLADTRSSRHRSGDAGTA